MKSCYIYVDEKLNPNREHNDNELTIICRSFSSAIDAIEWANHSKGVFFNINLPCNLLGLDILSYLQKERKNRFCLKNFSFHIISE